MYKLALTAGLFLLSGNALAAYTEAKACDTCDYDDAVRIAKLYYEEPNCQVSGLNGGELDQFGVTTYQCNTTSKEIIVTNALQEVAYKFIVTAEQQSEHSPAVNVIARGTSLTTPERNALDDFYEIDREFRQGVKDAGTIVTPFTGPTFESGFLQSPHSAAFSSASSGDSGDCSNHPSAYLTSDGAQREIEDQMAQQIAERIGNTSWDDFVTRSRFAGGGIQIGKDSLGVSLSLAHNQVGVFATRSYGGRSNKLVFKVAYEGEADTDGPRSLNLNFELSRGSSRVDGFPIGRFMSGVGFDARTTAVSNCLIENLASIAGASIEDLGGSGGAGGTGGGGSGFLVFGGGSGNCGRVVKYSTCSSTSNGSTSCTESSITISCGRL